MHELAIFTKLGGEVSVGLFLVSIATARVSITRVTRVTLSTIVIFIFISVLSGVGFFVTLPLIINGFSLATSK